MLAVDIGNSRLKWAVFCGEKIQHYGVFAYNENNFEAVLNESGLAGLLKQVHVSCVANEKIKAVFIHWLQRHACTDFEFAATAIQQCGVLNSYSDPAKMGVDRWMAMIAAYQLHKSGKQSAICIIDCGTAITFDVLNGKGSHVGGLIMPGYQTMTTSLGLTTGNIQATESSELNAALNIGLGVSTSEGVSKGCAQIISGGVMSIMAEVADSINEKMDYVLTGGDGEWLAELIQQKVIMEVKQQVKFEPFLVLQGLYCSSL